MSTKTYLRYELKEAFGVITGAPSASSIIGVCDDGKLVLSACLENIHVWNIKQSTLVVKLTEEGNKAQVSCLCVSPNKARPTVAAGYADGVIRVWCLTTHAVLLTLNGHKSAVTSIRYNTDGSLLASGSADTNAIVWDCVAEQGLYRLHGHKNKVTDVVFYTTPKNNYLFTSSADAYVKIWDLETQHCVQTLTGHRGEVWSIDIHKEHNLLVSGCIDKLVRVWSLNPEGKEEEIAEYMGEVERNTNKRVVGMRFDSGNHLYVQAADKTCDLYRIRTPEEVKKKIKRRIKRQKEKKNKQNKNKEDTEDSKETETEDDVTVQASDKLETLLPIRLKEKLVGCCFIESGKTKKKGLNLAVALANNSISVIHSTGNPIVDAGELKGGSEEMTQIALPGHRSGIRSLVLSNDGNVLASTDSTQLKLWNINSNVCVATLDTGYGLCAVFVPGDRFIVLGTRAGHIELWEIGSGTIIEKIQAHSGPVWSIDLTPDKKGFVSGGGDKEVKCWEFEISVVDGKKSKDLSLVHTRSLKTSEEVLCVRCSPDGRYIALGMLDSTIKVFYLDSFKFFLSLYGHKLPVLTLDISSDSTLLISGSADKNVKIWGLDFGDCHKSMFAHDDSVMKLAFVNDTHYFFSIGKDKALKYWDADHFEHVLTLNSHHAECWGLVVSKEGGTVITSSNDKSIRVWEQTDEQVFLDEERESRLEEEAEEEGAQTEANSIGDIEGAGVEGQAESSSVARGKAGRETLKAGERLMSALDLAETEEKRFQEWKAKQLQEKEKKKRKKSSIEAIMAETAVQTKGDTPVANQMLQGRTPGMHVLFILKTIKTSDLDEALMVLHFTYVPKVVIFLERFVSQGVSVELCLRCILFLLNLHQKQIIANQLLLGPLARLRKGAKKQLKKEKDTLGFNLAALKFLDASIVSDSSAFFFGEPKFKRSKPETPREKWAKRQKLNEEKENQN